MRLLVALLLLLNAPLLLAQGTVFFKIEVVGAVKAGGTIRGTGDLRLDFFSLNYSLRFPNIRETPVETHFHGPGVNGDHPIISLKPYVFESAHDDWPGGIVFEGVQAIDPKFMSDLKSGQWYVQLHSPAYVGAAMRGYILPVPEPGTTTLLTISLLALAGIVATKNRGLRTNPRG